MKKISVLFAMLISLQGHASIEGLKALSSAFDQYHYASHVEWDQKDQSVFEYNNKVFSDEINRLLSTKELSAIEVQEFLESKVADKSKLEEIRVKVENSESLEALMSHYSDFSVKGASWDGANQTLISLGAGIFIVGFVYWAALEAQKKPGFELEFK